MDPGTILALSQIVIGLSIKIYDFFKTVHDAPKDILDYLLALEQTRVVFEDTQDYLRRHISSSFHTHDGLKLGIVQRTLEDCKLEFALQLSFIESLDPSTSSSFFKKAVRKTKFVLSEEKIEAFTQKLQRAQGLLSIAIATTTGKSTALIRDKLEIVSLEIHETNERSKAESLARDQLLQELQQYAVELQDSAKEFLQLAKDTHIRGETRITDLSESLTAGSSLSNPVLEAFSADHRSQTEVTEPKLSNLTLERLDRSRIDFNKFAEAMQGNALPRDEVTTSCSIMDSTTSWESALEQWSKLSPEFAGFAERLKYISTVAYFIPMQYEGVISDSLRLVLTIIEEPNSKKDLLFGLVEAMKEMSEAIEMCHREQVLHQNPKLARLVEELYMEVLDVTKALLKVHNMKNQQPKPTIWAMMNPQPNPRGLLAGATAKIRRISDVVRREVDYQHRLETRRTSIRLVEMQIEQRRMVKMLEDQKTILQEMDEERKVMSVIQGQQEILRVVQQIQRKLQADADAKHGRTI